MVPRTPTSADDPGPGRNRARITLPLTPDGSIDFDGMRGSTKQKLHALVDAQIADIYKEAGQPIPGANGEESPPPDLFGGLTTENIRAGLDIMSQTNALLVRMVGPRFLRHPYRRDPRTGKPLPLVFDADILERSFALTEEQHAELDPRALRLAQKYSHKMPEWLKRHLDLYMLLGMYVKYTGENALTAMRTQVLRDVKIDQERAAQKPKPPAVDTDRPPATGGGNGVSVMDDTQPATDYTQPAPGSGPTGKTWDGQTWVDL